jgi:hypothetical protein
MEKGVRSMEKVSATRCLDVGRNMLVTSSQHVCHKLATSLATCTLCQGRREGSQHEKSVRNIRNTFRNIMIRRLICFLIRIVWLGRCPILTLGSDVQMVAVPNFFLQTILQVSFVLKILQGSDSQLSRPLRDKKTEARHGFLRG